MNTVPNQSSVSVSQNQRTISPIHGPKFPMTVSPMKQQRVPLPPQQNYVKPYQAAFPVPQQQNQYNIQVTPPRSIQAQHITTPSTAQTLISNNNANFNATVQGSAPSRFNAALDQVCLLGHEMDQMRKNFEQVQVELQQWKDKCALIKVIASTPPPGTNYSPTRTNKLQNDVQASFQNYQTDINKLNQILSVVNLDLVNSVDKIKQLERRVSDMNKLELEMLQAKKQAVELDNKNRFQTLELNDLKSKMDSSNQHSEDLLKLVSIIPNLKESVNVLEQENKKLISIIQQKDDQLEKYDQKHIQLTRMYQENLEKTNLVSQQLREALSENEEINSEVERTHNIADSVNTMNIQNSIYLSKPQQQQINQVSTKPKGLLDIEGSNSAQNSQSKRPSTCGTQSRNLRNNQRLNSVQNTIIEQQGTLEVLHKIIKDQENRISNGDKERTNMAKTLEETLSEIDNLKIMSQRDQAANEENLRKAQDKFADQISGSVIPLQKENESLQQELQNLLRDFTNLKHTLQALEKDKASLQDQLSLERQQAFATQQKIVNEFQLKCDALTETIEKKDTDLDGEILKNKELFDDNKLMAEEMRILKQKSAELEVWKSKYRDLKKEMKALRLSFDEYKKSFIREIQSRFAIGCDQFEQCLQYIDDRFDSTRGSSTGFQQENYQFAQQENQTRNSFIMQQIPPYQGQSTGSTNARQLSPQQDRLKQMKATPAKCSTATTVSKNVSDQRTPLQQTQTNIAMQLIGGQNIQGTQLIQTQQNNIPTQSSQQHQTASSNKANTGRQPSISMTQDQQGKYAKEIMQTNDELDNKLEELVVLKAKYEDALNRVHTNINSTTPKKTSNN